MDIYQSNINHCESKVLELSNALKRLSILRLVAFAASLVVLIISVNEQSVISLILVVPVCLIGFGILVNRFNQTVHLKKHYTYLKTINEWELQKLENDLSGFSKGDHYRIQDHPYVADLDIFGAHTLFQLLDRTTTGSGEEILSNWLSSSVSTEEIIDRQEAVKELSPKLEWRQQFQASGLHFKNAKDEYYKLIEWVEKPLLLLPKKSRYLTTSILLSALSTSAVFNFVFHLVRFMIGLAPFSIFSLIPLIIILFINARVLNSISMLAEDIIDSTYENIKILGGYETLIKSIESEQFKSNILARNKTSLQHNDYSAAKEIKKLRRILQSFQLRGTKSSFGNQFYAILNALWLLDVHWILQTEKWKSKNCKYLVSWAASIGAYEALNSIAGFQYSNPGFSFPEITDQSYNIRFEQLGHPLIHPKSRMCNDFEIKSKGAIALVTGSNMAGKSTFLRSVGINMVLAFSGAPCCAKACEIPNVQIFTSMRTQDDLERGISSFYAELRRIEQLLHLIDSGKPIFFLLDEVFKGTNSQDRHKGAFSLLKQLSKLNAFGIIATHDLDLAKSGEQHQFVSNYSFNSKMKDGDMLFNYELEEGICRDFNASELMRRSGINIL